MLSMEVYVDGVCFFSFLGFWSDSMTFDISVFLDVLFQRKQGFWQQNIAFWVIWWLF